MAQEHFDYRFKNGYSQASHSDDTAPYVYEENKSSVIE